MYVILSSISRNQKMKLLRAFSISCIILLICLHTTEASERGLTIRGKRLALVIGNGTYRYSALHNPVNDAKDMAQVLTHLGFSVILRTDANLRTMDRSIRTFGKQLQQGGVGLFYYAGHGVQVNGINYLIPVDAIIESESDIKYESVDAGRILGKMHDAHNRLNIIILDACRDNPFARSFRSSRRGLAKMDAPTGSIIAYSTAPGSVAADGTGKNGLYTSKLLKYIVIPGLPVERIFKKVRIEVMQESADKQVPWESSSLTGDFFFAGKPLKDETVPTTVPSTGTSPTIESSKLKRIRVKVKQGYWKEGIFGKTWVPPVYEYKMVPAKEAE